MPKYIECESIEYPYMSMSMWGLNRDTCKAHNEGVKAVEDYIANLPAADVVEVKHGKWIKNKSPVEVDFRCSECGFILTEADPEQECDYNYCHHCGAKMDGKGDTPDVENS